VELRVLLSLFELPKQIIRSGGGGEEIGGLGVLAGARADFQEQVRFLEVSGVDRVVALGAHGLGGILLGILLVSTAIGVGDDTEARWVIQLLGIIVPWSGHAIICVLLASVDSTAENGLREPALEISVDLVGSGARGHAVFVELRLIVAEGFRDGKGVASFSVLDDILILVRCRYILGQIAPLASSQPESGVLQLLGNSDTPGQFIGPGARCFLDLGLQVGGPSQSIGSYIGVETRSQTEIGGGA